MGDVVLVDGDQALFQPAFGAAVVVVQPGRLKASGPARIGGAKACVSGDEGSVSVPGCPYMKPGYPVPGSGTLTISALAGDQLAPTASTGSTKLMLKGSSFTAKFTVAAPATQPPPSGAPDATPDYSGSGSFVSLDASVKAG